MQVASVLCCYAVAGLFFGSFAASGPAFLLMSGLDTGSFGVLLFLMTVGALPAMTVLGNLIHRAPSLALPGCLSGFALAALVLGQAESATALGLAFLLVGAASGALDVALNLRISVVESETGAALFNRAHAAFPLAVLVAGPMVGAARDAGVGLGWVYAVLCGLMAAAALLELRIGARALTEAPDTSNDGKTPVALGPALLCLGAIAALGAFMEMAAQGWATIFLESVLGSSATVAGFAITAFMLGLTLGRLVAHAVDGRVTAVGAIRIGAVLAIPAFLLTALGGTPATALIGLFLAGVAVGPVEPTVYRLVAARHAPERRGRALSRITAIAYLGYLSSPVVLGPIADVAGWPALWTTAAAAALGALALTVVLRRLEPSSADSRAPIDSANEDAST